MKKFAFILSFVLLGNNSGFTQTEWEPLFNGKDLEGWYSFLPSRGRNNDSEKVFSVENGLLHISGKEFG